MEVVWVEETDRELVSLIEKILMNLVGKSPQDELNIYNQGINSNFAIV